MKKRSGVTLIEMMIAISLSSLVFMLVSSLLMTVIISNTRSKNKEGFEQVKNDLHAEFTNRIRWGEIVQVGSNSLITDGVVYTISGGRILKDGEVITPDNVTISSFDVKNLSTTPLFTSVELEVGMQSSGKEIINDRLRLVVSQRRTKISK